MKLIKITALGLLAYNLSYAQTTVSRNFNLELSENEAKAPVLEKSLNAFLEQAMKGKYTEEYVDMNHKVKYEFFFDQLSRIRTDIKGRTYNDPIVLKSYTPDDNTYFLTVTFSGINNGIPFIHRTAEIKAVPYKDQYRFYSPFDERTAYFKKEKIGNVNYYYSGDFDKKKAKDFSKFFNELGKLTGGTQRQLDYYKFQSLDELLKSYGLIYDANKCNFLCHDLGFTDNEGQLFVTGTDRENYKAEYIGDYLYYNLPDNDKIYWPFVRGVATYYGGYFLGQESVDELKQMFREELSQNPSIDFLEEFKKERKAHVNGKFSYFVMSSFLCQEVMDKGGFEKVKQLIYSGEKGENFFKTLNEVAGINESNFHDSIVRLISIS